jgi:hypothetical protein
MKLSTNVKSSVKTEVIEKAEKLLKIFILESHGYVSTGQIPLLISNVT